MDSRAPAPPGTVARERLVPSALHLHAARIDDRAIELLAQGRDRPSVALPPLGDLLGMLAWSLVPAVPLLALVDWQAAAVVGGAGLLVREIRRRGGRPEATFANGFLQFQGDEGRARGIQEDDDVRWRWRGGAVTSGREDGARSSWPGSINP
ncbi:MAG: hypothetical protein HY262_13860 [Chloroflexi bacterium]|nr:hypothetical protein [Chloroflexota bacterium]